MAAAEVLLDAALFRLVVSFQGGLPGRIYAYWTRYRSDHATFDYDPDDHAAGALVTLAVMRGDGAMLRELHALFLRSPYYRAMELLQFWDVVYVSARSGQLESLAWLHSGLEGVTCDARAASIAAKNGQARALRWVLAHCAVCTGELSVETAKYAAQRGHDEVLQCLYEQRPKLFESPEVLTSAVESGQLAVVMFLHAQQPCVTPGRRYCQGLMDKAAGAGQLEVVRYLHASCGETASVEAMNVAAANCHLDVVRFLHEHRQEGCTVYAMDQAAAQGHLDVVRFLHENRQEGCTVYAMGGASRRGHLEVVRFLHEHRGEGCSPWALAEAAEKGHLEVVTFLYQHRQGVDWEDSALFRAARNGHLEVVEYLCDHTRVGDRAFDARRAAKTAGKGGIVRVLDRQIKKLLEEKDLEQREKLRRRKHAKAKKKRK